MAKKKSAFTVKEMDLKQAQRAFNRKRGRGSKYDEIINTAENLAKEFGISREEQDAFALQSHQRTVAAQNAGFFEEEVVPVQAHAVQRDGHDGHSEV